jgi:hypothetical protein
MNTFLIGYEVHYSGSAGERTFFCHSASEAAALSGKLGHGNCRIVELRAATV